MEQQSAKPAALNSSELILLPKIGNQDQPDIGDLPVGLDFPCERQAVHLRHFQVDDGQQIGVSFLGCFPQAIERIGSGGGGVAAHFPCDDLPMKEQAACRVIIDDKHSHVGEPVIIIQEGLKRRRFLQTHGEQEGRAFAEGALQADLATHFFD